MNLIEGLQSLDPQLKRLYISQNNQYAPNAADIASLAERRKQSIQESKFLGGDMEHTHLVKGKEKLVLKDW